MTIPTTFPVVTLNVFSGTPVKTLEPVLKKQRDQHNPWAWLMQEAQGRDITTMMNDLGYATVSDGQFRLAWLPLNPHTRIGFQMLWWDRVHLSDTPYFAKGDRDPIYSDGLHFVMADGYGRTVEGVNFHTPPFVQQPDSASTLRRRKIAFESFATMGQIEDDSVATGFLAGGDMNIDPDTGRGAGDDTWDPIKVAATGLRIVQAPAPTHDKRSIDNFLTVPKGALRPTKQAWVFDVPDPGDHNGHGRIFRWVL